MKSKMKWIILGAAIVTTVAVAVETHVQSGFMTDYSQLEAIEDGSADYRYIGEGVLDRLVNYEAVMIDEPEVLIAEDSPYRGGKPRQFVALAETFRAGVIAAFSDDWYVVQTPGQNVLYFRIALSNVKLTKKKRNILGYTPVGLVGGAVRGAATTDIAKKANLQDLVLEVEVFDSLTEERLVAIIDYLGEGEEAPSSWEELEDLATLYGERLHCRLNNARLPEDTRFDCLAPAGE